MIGNIWNKYSACLNGLSTYQLMYKNTWNYSRFYLIHFLKAYTSQYLILIWYHTFFTDILNNVSYLFFRKLFLLWQRYINIWLNIEILLFAADQNMFMPLCKFIWSIRSYYIKLYTIEKNVTNNNIWICLGLTIIFSSNSLRTVYTSIAISVDSYVAALSEYIFAVNL